jgi:hypothetical protein
MSCEELHEHSDAEVETLQDEEAEEEPRECDEPEVL